MVLRPHRPQSRAEQLAARQSAQQEVFLREVDDALRDEQMVTRLKRWGLLAGGGALVGLAALAGGLWWNHHREATREVQAEQLTLSLDKLEAGQPDGALPALGNLAADSSAGTRAAAQLLQAAITARRGQNDAAVKLYQAVADDAQAPKPYRDLANVRGTTLAFDKLTPDAVIARLKPLAAPGNPWFGSAGELLAGAYLKQGRKDLAGPLLVAIARDEKVPASLRARTRQLAGMFGFDSIDDIARQQATPEQAPAGGVPPQMESAPAGPPQGGAQPGAQPPGATVPSGPQAPAAAAATARAPSRAATAAGPIEVNLPKPQGSGASAPAAPGLMPVAPAPGGSAPGSAPAAQP